MVFDIASEPASRGARATDRACGPRHPLIMFRRKVTIKRVDVDGQSSACPVAWIDNFAMRNFTNDAIFDETLPVADGLLEIGNRVPVDRLAEAMEEWFRRKGYLRAGEVLRVVEVA